MCLRHAAAPGLFDHLLQLGGGLGAQPGDGDGLALDELPHEADERAPLRRAADRTFVRVVGAQLLAAHEGQRLPRTVAVVQVDAVPP